jgi:predicted nucleic acid-binding protein
MKDKIYIDTSVLGGYFDIEFERDTKILFNRILNKEFSVYISEITDTELLFAPEKVKNLLKEIPADCLTNLSISKEVDELANTYISEKALGKASLNDAYHIAVATVNKINVLVSWNFKHIVNLNKIRLFNSVNVKLGYSLIEIRCPKELISYE